MPLYIPTGDASNAGHATHFSVDVGRVLAAGSAQEAKLFVPVDAPTAWSDLLSVLRGIFMRSFHMDLAPGVFFCLIC